MLAPIFDHDKSRFIGPGGQGLVIEQASDPFGDLVHCVKLQIRQAFQRKSLRRRLNGRVTRCPGDRIGKLAGAEPLPAQRHARISRRNGLRHKGFLEVGLDHDLRHAGADASHGHAGAALVHKDAASRQFLRKIGQTLWGVDTGLRQALCRLSQGA